MNTHKLDAGTLKTEQKKFNEVGKLTLETIFQDRSNFNEMNLFLLYFNTIPNILNDEEINCEKADDWFLNHFKGKIKHHHYVKRYHRTKKSVLLDDTFYVLEEQLIVHFDRSCSEIHVLFSQETNNELLNEILTGFKKFRKRREREKPQISILVSTKHGLDLHDLELTKSKASIESNYNDDFAEIHGIILKRLSAKNDKGLVLLHGPPGTGKTSYVHFLISKIKKTVIFLPPNMAEMITSPGLMGILIENPNSVLVIEDAENIITDRERDGNSPVSALLNLSDGLLSNCLNIQIVCSFNTDLSKVDRALMRKGRLIAKYEFQELEVSKAQKLSNQLGFDSIIEEPMTLTDIFNQEDKDFKPVARLQKIGF